MATGTGKTRTSIKIINELIEKNDIDQFIIGMNGSQLIQQWQDMFNDRESVTDKIFENKFSYFKDQKGRRMFSMRPEKSFLICSLLEASKAIKNLNEDVLARTLVIYDECHDLGTEERIGMIKDKIHEAGYLLGLSATPNKGPFAEKMNEELRLIFGKKPIYEYPLEKAIKEGVLCEFKYHSLDYKLSEEDEKERKRLKQQIAIKISNKEDHQAASGQLADIYKLSTSRLAPFKDFIINNKKIWKSTIVFAEEIQYCKRVGEILHDLGIRYQVLTGENKKEVNYQLTDFKKGKIDIVLTCKAIAQGIDIPNLQNIVLFSTGKSDREFMQKLGRVLRNPESDEKKVADVVDFYEIRDDDDESYDQKRYNDMNVLSEIKYEN